MAIPKMTFCCWRQLSWSTRWRRREMLGSNFRWYCHGKDFGSIEFGLDMDNYHYLTHKMIWRTILDPLVRFYFLKHSFFSQTIKNNLKFFISKAASGTAFFFKSASYDLFVPLGALWSITLTSCSPLCLKSPVGSIVCMELTTFSRF